MSAKAKLVLGNVIIFFLLLVVIEAISSFFTKDVNNIGFFVNLKMLDGVSPDWGFNEVDPLLGYAKTTERLNSQGLKIESNCAVLTTTDDTARSFNILITGGSTTDLSLCANNWPVELCTLLKANGIKAKMYVAAVGGYNSGQELLKLIRDGIDTKPLIHLSYSGANDVYGTQSYISTYEQMFFEHEFKDRSTFWLLPNTMMFLRNLFHLNHTDTHLHPNIPLPLPQFWEKNMRLMHGFSTEHNYRFIGLLQPVLGSGKFDQQIPVYKEYIDLYKKNYPKLQEAVRHHPDFLVDMTGVFDTCTGKVYKDNCHINDAYQKVVAMNVYDVLQQKHVFDK